MGGQESVKEHTEAVIICSKADMHATTSGTPGCRAESRGRLSPPLDPNLQ